ncbi:sialin isoform X2 [Anabrus simplex]|uniref:sialin isoform X2 n=1 Tax=Anabrus simplex TaxID=316456 RepID=UPI0035A2A7BE
MPQVAACRHEGHHRRNASSSTHKCSCEKLTGHSQDGRWEVPARYVLALLGFLGITLQYVLKVNLSVAIVAMVHSVNHSTSEQQEDVCPIEDSSSSESDGGGDDKGEFSWDEGLQGHLLSSYYYGYIATQLIGGRLAEHYGGRYVFGPGVALTGVLGLFSVLAARSNVYVFIALRVLQGMCSGVVIPSLQCMFSRWFHPKERARFSAIVFSSINFGSLAGLSVSGVLASYGGWPLVFYATNGAAILWFIPWILCAYDSPAYHPRISAREKEYILEGLGQDSGPSKKTKQAAVPWRKILTSPPVWAGILMQTGSAWVLYTLLSDLPTYLKNVLHYDIQKSGVVSSLPHLFAWLCANVCGTLSQWLRARGYVSHLTAYRLFNGLVAAGTVATMLTITLAGCNATLIVAMFVLTMVFNSCLYGGSYLNHMDLAVNYAGSISGVVHTVINMPGIIAPVVVGALINGQQTLTQWRIVFYLAMAIPTATFIFYLIFGSVQEQKWNRSDKEDKEPPQQL